MMGEFMTRHWTQGASAVAVGVAACLISGEVRAQSQAQAYATSGPWQIEFVPADRQRRMAAHCRATKIFGTENALRLVIGDGISTIEFMGFGSHALGRTFDVTYVFDNDASYVTKHTANMVADNDGVEWMRIDESEDGPGSYDAQKNTKVLTIKAATGLTSLSRNECERTCRHPLLP